jgi:hypothetical protein
MRCSWLLLPFLEWFFRFTFSEEIAQPVQPALPQLHALVDPLPGEPEARWSYPAVSHPPDLLGADHPALLEDLKMLEHRSERDNDAPIVKPLFDYPASPPTAGSEASS